MIKGINHKVIEITDTDSIYYERAWLVVRPQYEGVEEAVLRHEAKKLLATAGTPSSIKGKRTFWFWFLRFTAAALSGAAIAGAVVALIL